MQELLDIARRSGATKFGHPHYAETYARYFGGVRGQVRRVLELGVGDGQSLAAWEAWFPEAQVFGIDDYSEHARGSQEVKSPAEEVRRRGSPWVVYSDRSRVYLGGQDDEEAVAAVARESGLPFDLVVDDAGHDPERQWASLLLLFPHVRPGGCHVVEDVETSYRGRQSVVERIYRQVDVMNRAYQAPGGIPFLPDLGSVHFHPNIVFLFRASV